MSNLLKYSAGGLALAGLFIGASSAAATVLYDNGALNGTISAFTIGGAGANYAVSDSFTITGYDTLNSINFGVWLNPGDSISTVDWGITTTPQSYGGFIPGDSGTATVLNGSPTLNSGGYAISTDTISVGSVKLSPGTYYLVLQNAVATNNDTVWWDESDGLSSAAQNWIGSLANYTRPNTTGSESFQIDGTQSDATPEPAAWTLMLAGIAGLGVALRRRARAAAPAPARPVTLA